MKSILRNRTVLGLTCIVLSLIICFALTPMFNKALQAKTEVVRITKDISKGELITNAQVEIVEVGKYNLPGSVLKNKDNVVGKYAKADLFKGDYVLNTKVSDNALAENEYLYEFNGAQRAISVTIKSFAAGLSGKLEKGDIVSIIAVDYGEFRETVVPVELQYVKVLAVTNNQGLDKTSHMTGEEGELPSTVTLAVNPTQARLLAELEEKSKIHFTLVYRGSQENAQKFLNEQEGVINSILHPELEADDKSEDNLVSGLESEITEGEIINEE